PFLLWCEVLKLVERASNLVGAGTLKHLGLEAHVESGLPAERPRSQQGSMVRMLGDETARLLESGEWERDRRSRGSNGITPARATPNLMPLPAQWKPSGGAEHRLPEPVSALPAELRKPLINLRSTMSFVA